jgi:hypothetical protein
VKKLLAFILLITYFAFSSGVVINYHYCMNQLASAKLFEKESDVCGLCGMHSTDSEGCCHDEVKVLKAEDDQNTTASIAFLFKAPVLKLSQASEFLFLPVQNQNEFLLAVPHPPPLLTEQDTYLQNRVFRI